MPPIYHLLSSDIAHHNRTLLTFFEEELLAHLTGEHHFYVVSGEDLTLSYPQLSLTCFSNQVGITREVIRLAKNVPSARFLLHGQFNPWLWLAILSEKLPACRCIWHVWGADLYQDSSAWKFKLFYPLRRLAQNKLPHIWATRGDLAYAAQHLRGYHQGSCLYFPTKLANIASKSILPPRSGLTVLMGNSGDSSNRHLSALQDLKQKLGEDIRIIIPMGYPKQNHAYIEQVRQHALTLFSAEQIQILTEKLDFDEYSALLQTVDLGYFAFERQQGIGTLCLLIQYNIPVVLNPKNPFCLDMQWENVPFILVDQLSIGLIRQTHLALSERDKESITFFPSQYKKQWLQRLMDLGSGD